MCLAACLATWIVALELAQLRVYIQLLSMTPAAQQVSSDMPLDIACITCAMQCLECHTDSIWTTDA